jgi:hypothetical protein
VALATPLALAGPAFAGTSPQNPVTGTTTCNAEGQHAITWSVENTTNYVVTIDSATLSGSATGNPVFTPNPFQPDATTTSEGFLDGDIAGPVVITVEASWLEVEIPMSSTSVFTLNLTACPPPATTTTTSTSTTSTTAPSTTTTTTPPAVTPVVVTPRFTG